MKDILGFMISCIVRKQIIPSLGRTDLLSLTSSTWPFSARAGEQVRRERLPRSLGRIDVHAEPADATEAWTILEETCSGSIYQTRRFLEPWIAAFADSLGLTPMLIVAHDARGAPVAFMPFGVRRSGPFNVAEFLGGKDSNANMGLYHPDFGFRRNDLISIMRAASAKARVRPDLFRLANQPLEWEGKKNPLDIFPHQTSASFLHGGRLVADPAAFLKARQSKDAAKKLRKKRQKLEAVAPVTHYVARDAAGARRVLDAFFEQKLARFREKNIDSVFETAEARRFMEQSALAGLEAGAPALELHALLVGERIVATYGGGVHRGHLHLMVNSFDADPDIARSSPGDLLLQAILEQKCRDGLTGFDLGIGEARYKDSWCDDSRPLFDSIMPVTAKGHLFALIESNRLHAKRWIKQSEWARPFVMKLLGRS